jgi:hypothetical protein
LLSENSAAITALTAVPTEQAIRARHQSDLLVAAPLVRRVAREKAVDTKTTIAVRVQVKHALATTLNHRE